MFAKFQRWSTGKAVIGLLIPASFVYLVMVLYTLPLVSAYAGGMVLFDLSPSGYSFETASALLDALGREGRTAYLYQQLPLDFLYPALFASSCSLLLSWLLLKIAAPRSRLFYLCLIPIAAGLSDYAENILIINMLVSFPNVSTLGVTLASTLTVIKSTLTMAFFVLLIALCIVAFVKRPKHG